MNRYFKIYKSLIKMNFYELTTYRLNFINSTLSSLLWGLFQIITIYILTAKSSSFFGWSSIELLILVGTFNIFMGIFHALFSNNFEQFSENIHFGKLDFFLTKPIDSQFLMTLRGINFASFFRVILGIGFLIYLLIQNQKQIIISNLIIYILFLLVSLVLLYSIWLFVMTITVWYSRLSNLVYLLFSFGGTIRFPREMYQKGGLIIFLFFLPFGLVLNTPVKYLLNKGSFIEGFALILLTILLFKASRLFWNFALRSYTSAAS